MDLTRPDRGEALTRLTEITTTLAEDEVAPYFLLCMAVLAKNAPDVAHFVMDRADASLELVGDALARIADGTVR